MSEHHLEEDVQWMLAVKRGDQAAFRKIIKKNQRSLLNFFYYLNANIQEAEDLAQETFLKVYLFREKYTPTAKFSTFLFHLARNTAIDYFRKKKAMPMAIEDELFNVQEKKEDSWEEDKIDDLRKALKKLPEKFRSVIVMSYFENMKYQEIADVLEIPLGTVKSRMSFAVKALKNLIEAEQKNEPKP